MTMIPVIQVGANPTAPLATNPYLENDGAIVRGVTLAMFDLSNPLCYAGSGNLVGGTLLNNLVQGGSQAQVYPANTLAYFVPVASGTITAAGAVAAGSYPIINLPASFNLASTVTSSLVIVWAKFVATGLGASVLLGIIGSGTGNGTSLQYQVYLQADASGNALNLTFRVRGSAGNIDTVLTGASLAAILDGGLHQLGFAFTINGGTGQGYIYVDGAQRVIGTPGAMTAWNTPGGTPTLFAAPGVSYLTNALSLANRLGRPSIHDLSARGDLTFAGMLATDIRRSAGYVY